VIGYIIYPIFSILPKPFWMKKRREGRDPIKNTQPKLQPMMNVDSLGLNKSRAFRKLSQTYQDEK